MPKKQNSGTPNGQPILQLTSNQLIFAVCCLIVVGALLILLGMALAHLERTQVARQEPEMERSASEAPTFEGEGQQVSPRPLPREDRETTSRPRPVEIPAPTPEELEGIDPQPTPTRLPEPIPPPPETVEEPEAEPSRDRPEPAPIAELEPQIDEPDQESEPVEEPELELDDSTDDIIPEPAPEASTEPTQDRVGYTVQVAAFSVSNIAKAREFVQEHEAYEPELVEGDDRFVRVFIGSYATREEADQRRRELRAVSDFAECYVRARN